MAEVRPTTNCEAAYLKLAVAKVDEISFGKKGFSYDVEFDNETWIYNKGVKRPVESKHQFWVHNQRDLDGGAKVE